MDDGLRKKQAGVSFDIWALVEETGVEAGWREQCREAQVEGTCTHADGVQCQISSQNLPPQASPSNRYNRLPTCRAAHRLVGSLVVSRSVYVWSVVNRGLAVGLAGHDHEPRP